MPLEASRGRLQSLACGPSLHPQISPYDLPLCHHISSHVTLAFLPPSYKDPCASSGPPENSQLSSPLSILNLIISAESLLPWKVAYAQVLGIRRWPSSGTVTQPTTPPHPVSHSACFILSITSASACGFSFPLLFPSALMLWRWGHVLLSARDGGLGCRSALVLPLPWPELCSGLLAC